MTRLRAAPLLVALAGCAPAATCPPAATPEAPGAPHATATRPAPAARAPDGYVQVTVLGAIPSADGNVLLLSAPDRRRVVPVIIGDAEAGVINMRLRGETPPRPMTHDLLDTMIDELGGNVVMVEVNKITGGVFIGSISVWDGERMHRIDARTSDAVCIGVGHEVPIYVAEDVITESGLDADTLPPGTL